jgi:hypothetical protein
MDTDMASSGDTPASSSGAVQKKFEVKKWNAVALWAWGACSVFRATRFFI